MLFRPTSEELASCSASDFHGQNQTDLSGRSDRSPDRSGPLVRRVDDAAWQRRPSPARCPHLVEVAAKVSGFSYNRVARRCLPSAVRLREAAVFAAAGLPCAATAKTTSMQKTHARRGRRQRMHRKRPFDAPGQPVEWKRPAGGPGADLHDSARHPQAERKAFTTERRRHVT